MSQTKAESYWEPNPDYPIEDWIHEVTNKDTQQGFADWVRDRIEELEEEHRMKVVHMGKKNYYDAGRIEIDNNASISEGKDNGAYLQAWVWVSFDGTDLDKDPI